MTSYLLKNNKTETGRISQSIKGYVAACWDEDEGNLQILVKHHDKFEWLSIEDCLPYDSERDYPVELCEVTNIKEDK